MPENQRLLVDIIQAGHRHTSNMMLLLSQTLEAVSGKRSTDDVSKGLAQMASSLQDTDLLIKEFRNFSSQAEGPPAVVEVRRHATEVVKAVCAESRQLQEEMKKLTVTAQADANARFSELESRLLELDKRSQHHADANTRFSELESRLLELDKTAQHHCSRQEEMTKLAATSNADVSERFEKSESLLGTLQSDIIKVREQLKTQRPWIVQGFEKFQDTESHDGEEEVSTSLSPKSFHTTVDSADEEGTLTSSPFGLAPEEVIASAARELGATAEDAAELEAMLSPSRRTEWFNLDDDKDMSKPASSTNVSGLATAEPEVAAQPEATSPPLATAEPEVAAQPEATSPPEASKVGCAMREKRTGRQGEVIIHDIGDDMPYKVRFNDGQIPTEDWLTEGSVEMLADDQN